MSNAIDYLPRYMALSAVSERIFGRLKEMKSNNNIYLCPNGVNENFFIPADKIKRNDKLIIGWQGKEGGRLDQHGWDTILVPLRKKIEEEPNMEFRYVDRIYTNAFSREEMRAFYQDIDVFIHTGLMTGTPNPVFEAASCGKAVICTRIGAAEQMIKENVTGFIINLNSENKVFSSLKRLCPDPGKVVNDFMEKLRMLRDNREICEAFGQAGRNVIEQDWTWKKRAQAYISLFENHRYK
jgi:glycosyltransferase involved in cell wall biosynthesis